MGKFYNAFAKVSSGVSYFKSHWNKPPEGRYLSFKEWVAYCVGGMGATGGSVVYQYIQLMAGLYIAAALNIQVMHITWIGIATSLIIIITSPLISWMVDNTNTKYGKFRPYLIWTPIPIVICFVLIGFIPSLISSYWPMLIVYTLLYNLLFFFNRLYTLAFTTLLQVISPSPEERTSLMSIGTFCTSLGPSIVTALYPLLANLLFTKNGISGVNNIDSMKYIVPIFAAVFFAFGYIAAFGTKERMVIPKKYVQKQKFFAGIKKTFENKYFWIVNTSTVFGVFRLITTSFSTWVIIYMIYPELDASGHGTFAASLQSITTILLGNACIPGMLLAPWLIKKFGKKNLVIWSTIATSILAIPMIIFVKNPYFLLITMFFITLLNSVQVVTAPAMQAQIYDYQQFKTGDRLEGFLSQFGSILTTAIGIGTAFVAPAVYKAFGYVDNVSVLYDNPAILQNIIRTMCGIGLGSGLLAAIPYLFYDLTEDKHHQIMDVLTVRANHSDGLCGDEDAKDMEDRILNGEKNVLDFFKNVEGAEFISDADGGDQAASEQQNEVASDVVFDGEEKSSDDLKF